MIKQIKNSYCCVGLMSGTSLDGLDMVLCELKKQDDKWAYTIKKCVTIEYSNAWKERLMHSVDLSGRQLMLLHREYGLWLGHAVNDFLEGRNSELDLIASHGHTVFHEPDKNFNFQLGDANMIAATTRITTVADFRSLDICLNGQGAPLVPMGDQLLFSEYAACVNIGGFVNVSCYINGERRAWDICPANFVINRLANRIGKSMDEDGALGRKGRLIEPLLNELNALPYYQQKAPKSLAQEWVDNCIWPIINAYHSHPLEDVIRTCYAHFSHIIIADLNGSISDGKVLFTGGGVYNTFLMELIEAGCCASIVVPNQQLIDYKEALIFALLGVLKISGEVNCLKSVTGADVHCSSGIII